MSDVGPILARARAAFETRMRGACIIRRPIGMDEDELTGAARPIYAPKDIYGPDHPKKGKCYLRYPGLAFESNPEAGGFNFAVSRIVVRIPFGPVIAPGDFITITADRDNPQLVGTELRVASIDDMSQSTAQRLLCEDFQTSTVAS